MEDNEQDRRSQDADMVRRAIRDELEVHVRLVDQELAPDEETRSRLAKSLPDLHAFGEHRFYAVHAVLDWDHRLPSQHAFLRIHACYDDEMSERFGELLAVRKRTIASDNLYPEFDVADFGELPASELYVAVVRPRSTDVDDFRFLSPWRKHVETPVADEAVAVVRADPNYQRVVAARTTQGLGGPVVIGWSPPCLAHAERWAIEVWLLTEFDGHAGTARVFMVDLEEKRLTREYDTEVQLA